MDIATGHVIGRCYQRHRAVEFRKFLTEVEQAVPADLDIHLVLDNYATHKALPVKAWLARHPRYHLHFTPTSASWLNQVERWFALLGDKQIKRGIHRSIHDLKADIATFIQVHNTDPKPFIWTDAILQTIARRPTGIFRKKEKRRYALCFFHGILGRAGKISQLPKTGGLYGSVPFHADQNCGVSSRKRRVSGRERATSAKPVNFFAV